MRTGIARVHRFCAINALKIDAAGVLVPSAIAAECWPFSAKIGGIYFRPPRDSRVNREVCAQIENTPGRRNTRRRVEIYCETAFVPLSFFTLPRDGSHGQCVDGVPQVDDTLDDR